MDSEKSSQEAKLLWTFGTNLSSFLNEEGEWQWGYSIGLTFNFRVYKNLSMTLPFSYTRINAAPENVAERYYSNDLAEETPYPLDYYVYKMLVDRKISIGFLEFPILFSFKFLSGKKYDLSYLLGTGVVIATRDFSKPTQPDDVTITDEIIGVHDGFPLASPDETFTISNSGININTGIRFHVSRFYIDLLYVLYPYKIKDINKLNSISLRLGIDIH